MKKSLKLKDARRRRLIVRREVIAGLAFAQLREVEGGFISGWPPSCVGTKQFDGE